MSALPPEVAVVRVAAAPLDGVFGLELGALATPTPVADAAARDLESLRGDLVDVLYRAVPGLEGAARRAALAAKRDVFNARAVTADIGDLPPRLAARTRAYASALAASRSAERDADRAVLRSERAALRRLSEDRFFRAAIGYAGASLAAAASSYWARPTNSGSYSKIETSLYEFATRFSTKANPFYLYARLSFPPGSRFSGAPEATAALSLPHAHVLERQLLMSRAPGGDPYLLAHPFVAHVGGGGRFYVTSRRGLIRTQEVEDHPALRFVLDALRPGPLRRSELVRRLADAGGGREAAEGLVETLLGGSLLVPFLLSDPSRLVEELAEGGLPGKQAVALDAVHGWGGPLAEAPVGFDASTLFGPSVAVEAAENEQPAGYVTLRTTGWVGRGHEGLFSRITSDVQALAPVLASLPDVPPERVALARRARRTVREVGGRMPYLDLVAALRHAGAADAGGDGGPADGFAGELRAASGPISAADLSSWVGRLPPPPAFSVAGPVDYASGRYYVTNLWAGEGRYLRRFRPAHVGPRAGGSGPLAVTIYDPLSSNLDYAERSSDVGFAITPRHQGLFREWVHPADLDVFLEGGALRFQWRPSGRRVRFVRDGVALTRGLILEYRVLLLDVADTFSNPFWRRPEAPAEGEGLAYVPGASYGAVQVRRPEWVVRRGALPPRGGGEAATARALARWTRSAGLTASAVYYYTTGARATTHKPRYLRFDSALSVAAFYRRVRKLAPDDLIVLQAAAPDVAGLLPLEMGQHTSELVLEIAALALRA